MCLYPKIIKNRKYVANKKNGGVIPPITDERVQYVPVGCGNCMECRKQKARGWQVRLMEDLRANKNGKFITLTFSNESLKKINEYIDEKNKTGIQLEGYEIDNEIATAGTRLFLERWRKEYGKSLRHWLVTELGHNGTENIHIHGIVWTDEKYETIARIWQYGYIWPRPESEAAKKTYVNEKTVNYIVKYISKIDEIHKTYKSKVLTSAGIGRNYTNRLDSKLNKFKNEDTIETYRTRQGFKIAMPVYWRNKIYTEEEKEKLWLQRLDKEERWVVGEKVKISQGEEEYYKLLEFHRKRNKELGYGDDVKDWSREQYEKQRRAIMIKARLHQAQNKAKQQNAEE